MSSTDQPDSPTSPRLLDRVKREMRLRHMSIRTEQVYVRWILAFLRYHRNRQGKWVHPAKLGSDSVNQFDYSAADRNVAASTQNQALSAILFLYSQVLSLELKFDAQRAKRPRGLPVVTSRPTRCEEFWERFPQAHSGLWPG